MLSITRGRIEKPLRVIVYGPEGIGKSTFAAQFPRAVFIDTEGSTNCMDVTRLETPKDWSVFLTELAAVKQHPDELGTLVIDTADWAVRLCEEFVCKRYGKAGIEDFGYGKGYVYAKEEWAKALDMMTDIIDLGVNVVLTAHSVIRKFEKPEETGAYDRYELKMGTKAGSAIAALCKEWCDVLLFANYKEIVVEVNGKKKAQGGSRVMYTCHAPAWDAKNRLGMPPELPFDFTQIAQAVPDFSKKDAPAPEAAASVGQPHQVKADHDMYLFHPGSGKYLMVKAGDSLPPECIDNGPCREMEKRQWEQAKAAAEKPFGAEPVSNKQAGEIEELTRQANASKQEAKEEDQPRDGVDGRILQLCDNSKVTLNEVSKALQEMGQAPGFFPVKEFPPNIVEAVVVHWQEILDYINNSMRLPF